MEYNLIRRFKSVTTATLRAKLKAILSANRISLRPGKSAACSAYIIQLFPLYSPLYSTQVENINKHYYLQLVTL